MTTDRQQWVRRVRQLAAEKARSRSGIPDDVREAFVAIMEDDALFEACYGSDVVLMAGESSNLKELAAILMQGTANAIRILQQSRENVS